MSFTQKCTKRGKEKLLWATVIVKWCIMRCAFHGLMTQAHVCHQLAHSCWNWYLSITTVYYINEIWRYTGQKQMISERKITFKKIQVQKRMFNAQLIRVAMNIKATTYSTVWLLVDLRVKNDACDVLFWHSWQLMWEDILKSNKPQQYLVTGISVQCVADNVELNNAAFFLQTCRLVARRVVCKQTCLQTLHVCAHVINTTVITEPFQIMDVQVRGFSRKIIARHVLLLIIASSLTAVPSNLQLFSADCSSEALQQFSYCHSMHSTNSTSVCNVCVLRQNSLESCRFL